MKTGRYLHAQQEKRAKRQLKFLRVPLWRLLRDVRRKMAATAALSERQAQRLEIALGKAWRIAQQRRGDPGYLFSWHATEVECISKGKARAPYEFGCKVSPATNLHPAKGGHFILRAQALHGNPYDGHTLAAALGDLRNIVGRTPLRAIVDQGYKGHRVTLPHTAIYITGQKRGVNGKNKALAETPRGDRTGDRSRQKRRPARPHGRPLQYAAGCQRLQSSPIAPLFETHGAFFAFVPAGTARQRCCSGRLCFAPVATSYSLHPQCSDLFPPSRYQI